MIINNRQHRIKFMLTFELVQNDKHSTNRFATTEKSPIFQSHKSYTNTLTTTGQDD
jgi:hypothetical protein